MKKRILEIAVAAVAIGCSLTAALAGIGTVAVTNAETTVLTANDRRRWVVLQNNSTNDVYIRIDSGTTAVTTNNGIKVAASGGTFTITDNGQANAAMNGVKAIVASGTSALTYQDGNEY
jgi:hypothetical protein